MALFSYSGTDYQGKKLKGTIDSGSVEEVITQLRSKNITILDVSEIKQSKGKGRVSGKDLVVFTRQFASLISSGIPLVKSLGILAEQTEKPAFKNIILSVEKNIQSGNSLADSFSAYPQVFSPLFVNMVGVGEYSGSLDIMLSRLSSYLESYNTLVGKVKSAMMYPIGIVVVSVVVLGIIFTFVIPGFKSIFDSLGADLPMPTQIIINISNFVKSYIFYILGGISFIFMGLKKFISTPKGVWLMEKIERKMPVLGDLYNKMVLARFTKTLATLVRSGVPILNALAISGKTSGSMVLETNMDSVKDEVSKGKKVADCMKETGLFPVMVVSMVGVGEEGGDLAGMLEKVAAIYEEDVNAAVAGLLSLLEPLIIVFLGVVIGGIAISLFLPVFKMSQYVH